jgi:hypothetical protein
MTLNNSVKLIIGICTFFLIFLPLGMVVIGLLFANRMANISPMDDPFRGLDILFNFMFPAMCFLTLLVVAMYVFYVIHLVKNSEITDTMRVLSLLLLFFIPFIGMPLYYVLYIFLPVPPAWSIKPISPLLDKSAHDNPAA